MIAIISSSEKFSTFIPETNLIDSFPVVLVLRKGNFFRFTQTAIQTPLKSFFSLENMLSSHQDMSFHLFSFILVGIFSGKRKFLSAKFSCRF
jgi:hypothetical protein